MRLGERLYATQIESTLFELPARIFRPDFEACRSEIDDLHPLGAYEALRDGIPQSPHDRGIKWIGKEQERGGGRKVIDGVALAHGDVRPVPKAARAPGGKLAIDFQSVYRTAMARVQQVVQHATPTGAYVGEHVLGPHESAEYLREQTIVRVHRAVGTRRAGRDTCPASKSPAATQIDKSVTCVSAQ